MKGPSAIDVHTLLRQRRTVRVYAREPVPADVVRRHLEGAVMAPSAHNAQCWRFVVIDSPNLKRRLTEAMAARWERDLRQDRISEPVMRAQLRFSLRRFSEAPVLVLPCLTMEEMDVYPDRERRAAEWVMGIQSVAAAIHNLLLTAAVEGVGACWCCAPLFCQGLVRRLLKLPRGWEPQALLTIGCPGHTPPHPPRERLEDVPRIV